MSTINVTPLVDVMLVLLIIFMVTAPMLQQGVEIDLPETKGKGFSEESELVVTIRRNKQILIGEREKAGIKTIGRKLKGRTTKEVLIRADTNVPYGFVIKVMAEIKSAGIDKVGMVTNPEDL